MEATDIIEICEYILKQRELAVEKDESEDWVFEYLRRIDEKISSLEYYLKKKNPYIKIKCFWHGSISQVYDEYGWERNQELTSIPRFS